MANREKSAHFAKLAEQGERYDETADYMKEVASTPQELSVEERNLPSVSYRSIEQKEKQKGNGDNAKFAHEYCAKVETEHMKICSTILGPLPGNLLAKASDDDTRVFYHKMVADYYRYIAELKTDDAKKEAAENARKAYEQASAVAETGLAVTHPIRLGLALNSLCFPYGGAAMRRRGYWDPHQRNGGKKTFQTK